MTTRPCDELAGIIEDVRLKAELALLLMLDHGFGYADPRLPAETYLRNDEARARVFRLGLKPTGEHGDAADEVATKIAELSAPTSQALNALGKRFGLSAAEQAIFAVCCAYELDADVRSLCHALSGRRVPALYGDHCLELAYPHVSNGSALALALGAASPLRFLLRQPDPPHGALRLRDDAIAWLVDDRRPDPWLAARAVIVEPADSKAIDDTLAPALARVGSQLERDARGVVVIQGPQGCGKQRLAEALASRLHRNLIATAVAPLAKGPGPLAEAVREILLRAKLRDQVAYISGLESIGDRELMNDLLRTLDDGPDVVVLATRRSGTLRLGDRAHHSVVVPKPTLEGRIAAWSRELARIGADADAGDLGRRYVVGPSDIEQACNTATDSAALMARAPSGDDIEAALARQLSLDLGSFATRISRRALWDEMVVTDDVRNALKDMVAMVSERSRILEGWGYARHLGLSRGVSALFSGAPGTGKTMAASVISGQLGLELFRIDLSQVVSKWVGETEKHLGKIFDEAQNAHAMLLFDEADSLFGKRTDVKTSSDRYANLEVNYILQRMEDFDGVSILTTNQETALDAAFMRRLNFRVRFPEPEYEERLQLWQSLLPPETGLSNSPALEQLAMRFEMTGGYIRNAIVRAAVIAAREDREMSAEDLSNGALSEYYELGKVMSAAGLEGP